MEAAQTYITTYKRITDPLLDEFFREQKKQAKKIGAVATSLVDRMTAILIGGKRMRGALMCLGYELAGGEGSEIYKTSLFLELFHGALLIHDDVMDRDAKRRGAATIHTLFGDSMAINAGDLAFSWALSHLFSSSFAPDRINAAARIFAESFTTTVYGQILDISQSKNTLEVFRLKTAEYSGVLPLMFGAALAGRPIAALEKYGRCLGMIFQFRDEQLDSTSVLEKGIKTFTNRGRSVIAAITNVRAKQDLLDSFLVFASSWSK